jgi:putative ABC transport system permease protein
MDTPTGNVPLASVELLRGDPGVQRAVPLALGDSYRGARLVGTEPEFLKFHGGELAAGRMFRSAGEVVLGAEAARRTGLAIGQQFSGTHGTAETGSAHEASPLVVVGLLKPTDTVTDRLILTPVESIWAMHGIAPPDAHAAETEHHHGPVLDPRDAPQAEVTAILVSYRNAMAAMRLPSAINRETALQAASPATETARLLQLFGAALDGARLFAWLVAVTGLLSVFVVLLSAANAREGDMALLRVMGATRMQAAGTILLEGLLIAGAGAVLGLACAHALLALGAALFPTLAAVGVGPALFHGGELAIVAAVLGLGLLASLLPALRVYATDLADTLARAT